MPLVDNFNSIPPCDATAPGPLDLGQSLQFQYSPVNSGCDFTLFSEEDSKEESLSLQCPLKTPTSPGSYPTNSPDSFFSSEDAPGSPSVLGLSGGSNRSTSPAESLNALAERRLREDDGGRRRRKLSTVTPAKPARVEKKAPTERRKTKIKRPRQPSLFCRWEKCGASFTRQRDFEMHMGKHEKPLFFCEICDQLLTRKDNRRKHDSSKRHKENLAASQAKLANSPVLSPPSGSSGCRSSSDLSPTVSTSSSLSYLECAPLLFDYPHPQPFLTNQCTVTNVLPLNTEVKMLMLQAKITALGEKHEALNSELREVMQEMETMRRET
ncbi:hypothetical protein TWF730_002990 [Orbilia blumenaviensis]|uniref:Matrin-type domain-containing protein n=1 Tax=Orbilia blumenaviensis TaxID=1796055 RepID=A0AAV9U7P1_9PEZI